jgi:hypothetical protein
MCRCGGGPSFLEKLGITALVIVGGCGVWMMVLGTVILTVEMLRAMRWM